MLIESLEPRQLLAAQAYDWKNVVMKGTGFVNGIVFSPAQQNLVYANADIGGAYRWDQSASKWTPLDDWIQTTDWSVNYNGAETIAVDPTDANKLYMGLGTYMGTSAVLRSTDQGRTWLRTTTPFNMNGNGPGRNAGQRMVVDPNSPNILFYGTRDAGIYRSTDSGATWNKLTNYAFTTDPSGVTNTVGTDWVAIDKTSGSPGSASQVIYAGAATTGANKIWRSTNGGTTWAALPNAPAAVTGTTQFPLHGALTPDGSTLYLTYSVGDVGPNNVTSGFVYKVVNPNTATPTWTSIAPSSSPGGQGGWSGITLDPNNPSTMFLSTIDSWGPVDTIYRSTNGGASWISLAVNSHRDNSAAPYTSANTVHWTGDVQIDPFNANHVIFNTGYGLYSSSNALAATPTWAFFNDGLEESAVSELASPNTGTVNLFSAIGDQDGFRHVDFSVSPAAGKLGQNNGLNKGSSDDIDVAWNDASYLVRVTHVSPYVEYSNDNGVTWANFPSGGVSGGGSGNGRVAISADGTKTLYEPDGSGQAIYSTRSGTTWSSWSIPASNRPADGAKIVADLVSATTFYAYAGTTVSRSTDGGANWTIMNPVTAAPGGGMWLRAVPGNAGHLLLTTGNGGIWRSTDAGATWTRLASGTVTIANELGVGAPASVGGYPAIFIGGTVSGQNGFFRSDDQGATWTMISDLAHQYGDVIVIQGDPRVYGRLYVGTNGRGVLYADIHQTPPSLPAGWTGADINTTGGASGESSGTFDITGGGLGVLVGAAADQFRFTYRQLTGDGVITARVTDFSNGAPNSYIAKAGVMIRDTLAINSANAFVALTPGSVGGVAFTTRAAGGASTTTIATATTGVWPPYWVRLVRTGNSFTAYRSADGVNWTALGAAQPISMGSTVYFGLAVTAGSSTQVDISRFTNVTVQPITAPVATIGQISPEPHATGIASFTITFDQAVTGFDLSDLTLSRDGGGVSLAGATLSSADGGVTWTLAGTSGMTDEVGSYMLTVVAAGSNIQNTWGSSIAANESESWTMNVLTGGASADQIRLVRNGVGTEYWLGGVLQYSFNDAQLPTLVINTSSGDDALTLDYSAGDPASTGATFDAGGDNDTLTIVGTTGVDSAVFNSATASFGALVNHANVERFSFNGNGGADNLSIDAVKVASLAPTQVLNSLAITNNGTLDLLDHAVVVNNGDLGTFDGSVYTGLSGLVAAGRNGGQWNRPGIVSSIAAAQSGLTSVAVGPAATVPGNTFDSDSILLRYTYAGDANLDGKVNIDDYTRIDSGVAANLNGWINGDLNYDGKLNIDDYVVIDSSIAAQGDPL